MRAFSRLVLSCLWLASLAGTVVANEHRHIRTSSLLTCMPDSHFQATFFDVKFTPHNNTVSFNVDATTTLSGEVVAQVDLFAYGLKVIQREIDFCGLGVSALCQLKVGRINVNYEYEIQKDIVKDIPGVAYTIPDLDAQVRVLVYQKDDTEMKEPLACVQAVLSNGKTVQTRYASWPIAAIAGVGIITSGFVSVVGHSTTAAHIASNSISLFIYFQNLAITSMMGVARVPPIAAAWAQNFQWSMGIIKVDFMQKLFRWYVQATGGTPVLVHSNREFISVSVQKRRVKRALAAGAQYLYEKVGELGAYGLPQPVEKLTISNANDVNFDHTYNDGLFTTDERNPDNFINKVLVLHGIQRVAFKAGIELSNVFLTGIAFFLIFVVLVVVSLVIFKVLFDVFTHARVLSETSKFSEYRRHWGNIIKGTLFRIAIIAFPQVSLLCIWEFTQSDSPATVIDAAVIFLVLSIVLVYGAAKVILIGRKSARLYKAPAYLLYGDTAFLSRYGFLYVQFKANFYWWLMPLLTYSFLRSLVIAVLQEHGKVQAMVVFAVELIYFLALCFTRPYLDKRTNIFNIALHLVNLMNAIFFLFFSGIFKQPPIVSSVMAIVLFFMNAAFALFLLIFTVFTCTLALVHRNPDSRYQPMKDDRVSFIPKVGGPAGKGESSLDNLGKTVLTSYGDINEKKDDFLLQPGSGQSALYDQDDSANSAQLLTAIESPDMQSAIMGPNSFGMRPMYQRIPTAPKTTQESGSNVSRQNSSTNSPIDIDSPLNSDTRYHGFLNNSKPPYPQSSNMTASPSYSTPTGRSGSSNNNSNDFYFEQQEGAYSQNPRYM